MVLQRLHEVGTDLQEVKGMLAMLMAQSTSSGSVSIELPPDVVLPLQETGQIVELDSRLEDKELERKFVSL